MDMTGQQRIPATREVVWAALNDPEVLKACIPGCQELNKTSDSEMTAIAVIKVGPVSAKFQGAVTLSDLDPPNGYRITGEGQGGVAGFAKGSARIRLEADGDATLLNYEVSADIGGKLAQLGGRLIDATARKMSDAFFKKFSEEIQGRGTAQTAPATEGATAAPSTEPCPAAQASPSAAPRAALAAPRSMRPAAAAAPDRTAHVLLAAILIAVIATAWLLLSSKAGGPVPGLALSSEFVAGTVLLIVAAIGYLLGRLQGDRNTADVRLDADSFAALVQSRQDR
jgi:carbon monoxide dehydrogenase subunit G